MPRGIPASGKRRPRGSGKRGPQKKYVTKGKGKKTQTRSTAKSFVDNEITPLLEEVRPILAQAAQTQSTLNQMVSILNSLNATQQHTVNGLTHVLNLHVAGFLDAWRQYHDAMKRSGAEVDVSAYLQLFKSTASVLAVSTDRLMQEVGCEKAPCTKAAPKAEPKTAALSQSPVSQAAQPIGQLSTDSLPEGVPVAIAKDITVTKTTLKVAPTPEVSEDELQVGNGLNVL